MNTRNNDTLGRSRPFAVGHRLQLAALGFLLTCLGCASGGNSAPDFTCTFDPALSGTWESSRTSQLGPAKMKIELDCSCSYRTTVTVFGGQEIKERGPIRFDAGTAEGQGSLTFFRENGTETTWRYRRAADTLELEEAPGEWHTYEQSAAQSCAGTA